MCRAIIPIVIPIVIPIAISVRVCVRRVTIPLVLRLLSQAPALADLRGLVVLVVVLVVVVVVVVVLVVVVVPLGFGLSSESVATLHLSNSGCFTIVVCVIITRVGVVPVVFTRIICRSSLPVIIENVLRILRILQVIQIPPQDLVSLRKLPARRVTPTLQAEICFSVCTRAGDVGGGVSGGFFASQDNDGQKEDEEDAEGRSKGGKKVHCW
ncbi:hypothetical protein L211DRAFT_833342 [Terfezia boudieri ATCC MYA-4762]|uniref:Uncharacterized protein n=1 Tax=Terfezia boudieri ATCC MYA-4762 TaxID=1051890 RepID=A0A3N4LZN7_9PEZI|nr:hypothetical protein L211DRAFT_833342 [Terfezia boudieri ATCC MYA-4762]